MSSVSLASQKQGPRVVMCRAPASKSFNEAWWQLAPGLPIFLARCSYYYRQIASTVWFSLFSSSCLPLLFSCFVDCGDGKDIIKRWGLIAHARRESHLSVLPFAFLYLPLTFLSRWSDNFRRFAWAIVVKRTQQPSDTRLCAVRGR